MRGSAPFMEECHARFGDIFTLDLIPQVTAGPGARRDEGRFVFLAVPAHVKQVFTADPGLVRTGETNMFLRPVVGRRSILVLDEPEHMAQRKLLLPTFHGEAVRGYGDLMTEVARSEVEPMQIGGYALPAGTWLAPCGYLVHRRPDLYPEPNAQFEMIRVLQAVLASAELRPASATAESIGRRFITLAPSRGARVVLTRRPSSS
jgi:cytochrome P450